MLFTAIAVGAGLVVGLLGGGSLQELGRRRFRLWPLLPIGIALQLPLLDALGSGGLLAAYACLLVFAVANLRFVGMGLVVLGIALNMVPIAADGGMPVRQQAVVDAGISSSGDVAQLGLDRKHHLQRPSDRVTVLGDIIPLSPLHEVLSFG